MRKLRLILGLAVLAWGLIAAWRIGSCELANYEFRDDILNIASQGATRIGLSRLETDDEIRLHIIRIAAQRGIHLEPGQVAVHTTVTSETFSTFVSVDYHSPVRLLGFSLDLHFTPAVQGKPWGPRDLR